MKALITISLLIFSMSSWATKNLSLTQELWYCSHLSDLDCVKNAIAKGADVFSEDEDGRTALQLAIMSEEFEVFQFLLKQYTSLEQIMDNTSYGNSPLHLAARSGNLNMVQALIQKFPDIKHVINQNTSKKETPLHIATDYERLEVVQFLIKKYPEPEHIMARKKHQLTALHTAASVGSFEIAQLLINAMPKQEHIMARDEGGEVPLHRAASFGNSEVAQLLIKAMPKQEHIIAQNKIGQTPLHKTNLSRDSEVVQLLIEATSKTKHILTIKDDRRETPFHRTARNGDPKNLRLIIKALPSDNFFLDKNLSHQTPFGITLIAHNLTKARIIFGLSPLKIKKQLIQICQDHSFVDQQFCQQLATSLEEQTSSEIGDYQ